MKRCRDISWRCAASLTAACVLGVLPLPGISGSTADAAEQCVVSATLVNSCRPWLGAVAGSYPGSSTFKSQLLAHEQRIGRQVDVVHSYHAAGAVALSTDERYFVDRGTILYANWRPANKWADGAGGNATVNTQIDTMAASIRSVAPKKVMLALFGEPERYVTPGTSSCPGLKGTAGSPAEYRSMWSNVRSRFDAAGVTNVVWVMNYLGYVGWDCLFPEVWPGNALVDWIVWDPYIGPRERWDDMVGYFYQALESKADSTHAYTSKTWGLAEFGFWYGTNQTEAYRMYDDAKASLEAGRFPRLKLYEPFDTVGDQGLDTRISYTVSGAFDGTEQARYNAFAHSAVFSQTGPPVVTDHLVGCDTSLETGLSCFSGTYTGSVWPQWQTADGHQGSRSAQVTNSGIATATAGLNVRPVPVGSTVPGRTYTGGVWVRASAVGLPITLLLRERRPSNGTAPANGYASVTWSASDTQWRFLTAIYTAKEAANTITFSVYSPAMSSGRWFRADDFSLSSQAG